MAGGASKDEQVTKSNVVYRVENAEAGLHSFVVYTVFGTFDDVRSSLAALHKKYGPKGSDGSLAAKLKAFSPHEGDVLPTRPVLRRGKATPAKHWVT